jgi:hypothetical protein
VTTRFAIDTQLASAAQAYIGTGAAQQPYIRANHHFLRIFEERILHRATNKRTREKAEVAHSPHTVDGV